MCRPGRRPRHLTWTTATILERPGRRQPLCAATAVPGEGLSSVRPWPEGCHRRRFHRRATGAPSPPAVRAPLWPLAPSALVRRRSSSPMSPASRHNLHNPHSPSPLSTTASSFIRVPALDIAARSQHESAVGLFDSFETHPPEAVGDHRDPPPSTHGSFLRCPDHLPVDACLPSAVAAVPAAATVPGCCCCCCCMMHSLLRLPTVFVVPRHLSHISSPISTSRPLDVPHILGSMAKVPCTEPRLHNVASMCL